MAKTIYLTLEPITHDGEPIPAAAAERKDEGE